MSRKYFLSIVGLLSLLAVGLSGCGGGKAESGAATAIVIKNFQFEPANLQVKAGETITVRNDDDVDHTVTASDKSFDTGPLKQGQTATITVPKAGTYGYVCSLHTYMTGVIQVS